MNNLIPVTNQWGLVNMVDPAQVQILESIEEICVSQFVASAILAICLALLCALAMRIATSRQRTA